MVNPEREWRFTFLENPVGLRSKSYHKIINPKLDNINDDAINGAWDTVVEAKNATVSSQHIATFQNSKLKILDRKSQKTLFEKDDISIFENMHIIGHKLYYLKNFCVAKNHTVCQHVDYELHVLDFSNEQETCLQKNVRLFKPSSHPHLFILDNGDKECWYVFDIQNNLCLPFFPKKGTFCFVLDAQRQRFAVARVLDGNRRIEIYKYDQTPDKHNLTHTIFLKGLPFSDFEWKHDYLWIRCNFDVYKWSPDGPSAKTNLETCDEIVKNCNNFVWVDAKLFIQVYQRQEWRIDIFNFTPGEEVVEKCLSICKDDRDSIDLWVEVSF